MDIKLGGKRMSVNWEKQEGNTGVLTFEVDAETFEGAMDQAFKKVAKDVQIPGFRKGKIPRNIFESRFGVESLYQDAVDIVLPDAYMNAVEESGIEPIDQPEIDVDEIERGKSLVFTAKVSVKPELTLGDYKGLEVEEQSVEVTEEEVEEELNKQREQQAELIIKEDGEVEDGNTVVIDFEGFMDDEPFEGGQAENHSLEVGSGQFIPGFEEQLIGRTSGEELDVELTFPEDYQAEELAGKEALFKVKIHEVKEKEVPELDDELAKDIDDDVETLDELKTKTKEQLEEQKQQDADNAVREQLIEQASDNASVDIPSAMVETELEQMMSEFEQRLQSQGMTMEMYSQFSGQDEAALKEQMKSDAEKRVKTNLTLEAISEAEDLTVSDEDVSAELENMASVHNIDMEQIKQILGGNTDAIKSDLKFQKAIDVLVEHKVSI